ncbi:MAG: methyltransferase domain-containing protein [Candidatus Margulisiibacteriota bacterium]
MQTELSNYNDYDYKQQFWVNVDRRYEDTIEKKTLHRLLSKIPKAKTLLDAGCGFGRLFPAYQDRAENFVLMDYSDAMLDQAKGSLGTTNITYQQGNLINLPFADAQFDTVFSIRTLHHVEDPKQFFKEVYRVLKPGGHLLFEIPNKRHVLNIVRYSLCKTKFNPFAKGKVQLNTAYFNFHPTDVLTELQAYFEIQEKVNLSFFRSGILKKTIPYRVLVALDLLCQRLFSFTNLTPSIYCLCRKK